MVFGAVSAPKMFTTVWEIAGQTWMYKENWSQSELANPKYKASLAKDSKWEKKDKCQLYVKSWGRREL